MAVFAALAITACGDATSDTTPSGANASLSAAAVFDAAGTWNVKSNDCGNIPVPGQFDNSVQSVASDVQTFQVSDFQADNGVIVLSSEGTLDAKTGAYKLCYSSTLSDCQMNCAGTVDAANYVDLVCNKPSGELICTMALQKKEHSVQ